MISGMDGIIYLTGSVVILFMYATRKNRLPRFRREDFPELDRAAFSELQQLLENCCERLLLLGIGLLVLASVSLVGLSIGLRAFFLVVVFVLFFASMNPRHQFMKKLLMNGIQLKRIREAGVKL